MVVLLGVLVGVAVPRAGRHSDIHALYLEKINPTVFVGVWMAVWMAGSVTQSAAAVCGWGSVLTSGGSRPGLGRSRAGLGGGRW
jgi:hypothetical protein